MYRRATVLELKALPQHLKYAYLGSSDMLPIIIVAHICKEKEQQLLSVMKAHEKAIGWTIAYIRGISLSFCMHKIVLEEASKIFVPTKAKPCDEIGC